MKVLYGCFLCAVTISCSQFIEVEVKRELPKAVVNAIFNPDSTWQVSLTKSADILDEHRYLEAIRDATVTITDHTGEVVETLTFYADGYNQYNVYRGSSTPKAGEVYVVTAAIGGEIFRASSNVPMPVPITSLTVDSTNYKNNNGTVEFGIRFTDPPNQRNYYSVKIIHSGYNVYSEFDSIYFEQEVPYEPVDPKFQEGSSDGGGYWYSGETLFTDNTFEGRDYEFRVRSYIPDEDTVHFVLLSISEEYYQYFVTKRVQDNSSVDPFSQPAQVYSNIENGVGIFAGFSAYAVEFK